MSKEKYKKDEIQLGKDEVEANLIEFDIYFRFLMHRNPKILAHHKAPMRQYAEQNGLKGAASLEEFEEIFKAY